MRKIFLSIFAIGAGLLAAWWAIDGARAWRYAHQPFEVEEADAPTFSIAIPKGWRRPNYANPREDEAYFSTSASTSTLNDESPYFVFGPLSITDEGKDATADHVVAEWRKQGTAGTIQRVKFGSVEAQTWTDIVGGIDVAGESRTSVFAAPNGHLYSAYYMRAPGASGMRQDYVFGRVLASMKFHEPRSVKRAQGSR